MVAVAARSSTNAAFGCAVPPAVGVRPRRAAVICSEAPDAGPAVVRYLQSSGVSGSRSLVERASGGAALCGRRLPGQIARSERVRTRSPLWIWSRARASAPAAVACWNVVRVGQMYWRISATGPSSTLPWYATPPPPMPDHSPSPPAKGSTNVPGRQQEARHRVLGAGVQRRPAGARRRASRRHLHAAQPWRPRRSRGLHRLRALTARTVPGTAPRHQTRPRRRRPGLHPQQPAPQARRARHAAPHSPVSCPLPHRPHKPHGAQHDQHRRADRQPFRHHVERRRLRRLEALFVEDYQQHQALATSTESTNVHWVPRAQISGLQMDRSMQRRINHYLEPGATLYFD